VVAYEDVVASGGWDEARRRGLLRVEGKDYVVREGDVLHIRFAV
jgi:ribosome-binding ATPase YchF (GTP1/OBG family)